MQRLSIFQNKTRTVVLGLLVFVGLYLLSLHDYLLFHSLSETYTIIVAFGIFMVSWNSRRIMDNNYFLFVGGAFFFIGALDLFHTLTHPGIQVFGQANGQASEHFWLASRYFRSLALLLAPLFLGRRFRIEAVILIFSAVFLFLLLAIFHLDMLGWDHAAMGRGISFHKNSAYGITGILLFSLFLLLGKREHFDPGVLQLLILYTALTIGAEFAFAFHGHVHKGYPDLAGHLTEVAAYYIIYKAIIQTGLVTPYGLLFRNLKQNEEALRQERDRAQRYLDIAGVLVVGIGADQKVFMVNRKGCQVLGYSEEEIIGQDWCGTFVPERVRANIRQDLAELLAGRRVPYEGLEGFILQRSGGERTISWHNTLLTDEVGNITGILSSGEDMTDRKRVREELQAAMVKAQEEKAKNEAVIAGLGDGLSVQDLNFKVLFQNQIHKDFVGDHAGECCYRAYEKREEVCSGCPLALAFEDGKIHSTERSVPNSNGQKHYEVTASPLRDGEGKIVAGIEVVRDITERMRVEEELRKHQENLEELVQERTVDLTAVNEKLLQEITERMQVQALLGESEKKFRGLTHEFYALLDAIPDALLLLTPNLEVLWANKGAARMLAKEGLDLAGKHCYHLMEEGQAACDDCHAVKCFRTGTSVSAQISSPDGRFFDANAFPIKNEKGNVEKVIMIYRDVTEKITLQAEAMRAGHLASLGELAAGVAHEINNPTNGIINYAQILANRNYLGKQEVDIARRIMREGDRIARIVKSLLSFARDRKEEKVLVHIEDLLSETLALTEKLLQKNGIHLRLDVPRDLPAIVVNPQQVQQVFLNIINNAQYALNERYPGTDPNKVLEILSEVRTHEDKTYVRTTFHDRGPGIPVHLLGKVMNPFFSSKPGGQGTGLGLSISHGIISDHRGTLLIESQEGAFTKIHIDLPADMEGSRP